MSWLRRSHSCAVAGIRRKIHHTHHNSNSAHHDYFSCHKSHLVQSSWLPVSGGIGQCASIHNWTNNSTFANNNDTPTPWVSFSAHNKIMSQMTLPRWNSSLKGTNNNSQARARINRSREKNRGRTKGPDMRACQSIEEIAQMANDHLDNMSPRDLSAFWTLASKILKNRTYNNNYNSNKRQAEENQQLLASQINSVFVHTMKQMATFRHRELAQTALGFARITNMIDNSGHGGFGGGAPAAHQILHGLLIGQNSKQKERIFQFIAKVSMPILSKFDAQCLCNLAYATVLAKAGPIVFDDGSTLFDRIAEKSIPLLGSFQPQTFSNMVWSFEKVAQSNDDKHHRRLFEGVADHIVALPSLEEFKPQELSNTLLAFAKMGGGGGGSSGNNNKNLLFEKLADHIVNHLGNLGHFKPQELVNILWAYAKAEESNPSLCNKVANHIVALRHLGGFNSNDLATLVWVFAKSGESNPFLFEKIADHIISLGNMQSFELKHISMLVWSYATAKENHPALFKKVADHVVANSNLEQAYPEDLSNIIFAFAKAEQPHPTLFKEVANAVVSLEDLAAFEPWALSSLLWAFAKCEESSPRLFKKVADHIVALDNLEEFNAQDLSNTVWACASAKEVHAKLYEKVANHIMALDHLDEFAPQSLSNILLAFARATETNPQLFNAVADHIVALSNLREFKPQELSNIVWAYSNARVSHPVLFERIKDEAIARQNEFHSQEMSVLLWSYANLGETDTNLFLSMEPAVSDLFTKCNIQELTTIAWAYAVANVDAPNLFGNQSTFSNICIDATHEFTNEDSFQLHQWCLWQRELKSDITLPQTLEERCYNAFISNIPNPSALQNDVISGLSAIGLEPQEEFLTGSGYQLDALVEVDGNKIGIEVDGPFHFVGRRPDGSTMLKRRQVASLDGIPVISVPYWDWSEHGRNSDKKQQYLLKLLGLDKSE